MSSPGPRCPEANNPHGPTSRNQRLRRHVFGKGKAGAFQFLKRPDPAAFSGELRQSHCEPARPDFVVESAYADVQTAYNLFDRGSEPASAESTG